VETLKRVIVQVQGLAERNTLTIRLAEVTWHCLDKRGADVMEVVGVLWRVCEDRGWSLLDAEGVRAEAFIVKFPSPIAYISLTGPKGNEETSS
jgi:hypothetical protein